jgi:hypothetical protein
METTNGTTIPKGKHTKVSRPKQDGYEIALNFQDDQDATDKQNTVKQIWVRFGTFEGNGNFKWSTTIGPVEINKGGNEVVVVDDDQLPIRADSCYYQLLCEIDNEHGEPEILMTEETLLQNPS